MTRGRERLLVGVRPDDQGEELVRFGRHHADAFGAEWIVVSVETPPMLRLGNTARDRRVEILRLAESLGAETVTLEGPTAGAALLEYARTRNASRIVIGEPRRRGWRALLRRSTASDLIAQADGIDVSILARRHGYTAARERALTQRGALSVHGVVRYVWAVALVVFATLVAALMHGQLHVTNLVLVYLLCTTLAGVQLGRGPSVLTAVLGVAAFNFFFVAPRFTFIVAGAESLFTLSVMLVVALTIGTLTANVRQQTKVAGARERRTALLYGMSRELVSTCDRIGMARVAIRHVSEAFTGRAALLLSNDEGRLQAIGSASGDDYFDGPDMAIAKWVVERGRPAGLGTNEQPRLNAIYIPLVSSSRTFGVLAVLPLHPRRVLLPEQRHLLETFAGQIALAIERLLYAEQAEAAKVAVETEALRNTLLAAISHDLRTPLAVITGASTALADHSLTIDSAARAALAESIARKAVEMSELISNVLDLMRFESGLAPLRREWQALDDLVGVALHNVQSLLGRRLVTLDLGLELPELNVDAVLLTQVLVNLLENAAKHTPDETQVVISARALDGSVQVVVEDDGPGLPPGDPDLLFAKFQRGCHENEVAGAGLGLAICRVIVQAHGGTIIASNRDDGGARFAINLPIASVTA